MISSKCVFKPFHGFILEGLLILYFHFFIITGVSVHDRLGERERVEEELLVDEVLERELAEAELMVGSEEADEEMQAVAEAPAPRTVGVNYRPDGYDSWEESEAADELDLYEHLEGEEDELLF